MFSPDYPLSNWNSSDEQSNNDGYNMIRWHFWVHQFTHMKILWLVFPSQSDNKTGIENDSSYYA